MPVMDRTRSLLLVVDLQSRLVPAMAQPDILVTNARRLMNAARILGVPTVATEQNPAKLGGTVAELQGGHPALAKLAFSATGADGFDAAIGGRTDIVLTGCEAHVCVLQTALALRDRGCRVSVVEDAVSSRAADSKAAALRRLSHHGIDVVTTEMVVFEWLGSAADPRFREVVALVK